MKIIVTGASGYIGTGLVRHLLSKGHTIFPVDLIDRDFMKNLLIADAGDMNAMEELISSNQVDALIHLAAMSDVQECQSDVAECYWQNFVTPMKLAKLCLGLGVKFIYASTYGHDDYTQNHYTKCKTLTEVNLPPEAIIVKMFNVAGAYQGWQPREYGQSISDAIFSSVKHGKELSLYGNATRRFVNIREVFETFQRVIDDIALGKDNAFPEESVVYTCDGEKCQVDMETWVSLFRNVFEKPIPYTLRPGLDYEVNRSSELRQDNWISYDRRYVEDIICSYQKYGM